MDAFKLLSRSTKLSKGKSAKREQQTPSAGLRTNSQQHSPQAQSYTANDTRSSSRKRKRAQDEAHDAAELDFFGSAGTGPITTSARTYDDSRIELEETQDGTNAHASEDHDATCEVLEEDQRKEMLKKQKLKVTWLNPTPTASRRRHGKGQKMNSTTEHMDKVALYPQPLTAFSQLRSRNGISKQLAANIEEQGYDMPSEVQMAALPLLLDDTTDYLNSHSSRPPSSSTEINILTVAPTGSGKTLAFMIPLIHKISTARHKRSTSNKKTFAIVVAPTKELAAQITNEGRKLTQGTGVRISQLRKGMRLGRRSGADADASDDEVAAEVIVKSDILVSTPGILASAVQETSDTTSVVLSDVKYLVLDEADVLLDPLFREQTLSIWNSLPQGSLHVSLWSATMGSNVEELARSTINNRRVRVSQGSSTAHGEAPLVRLVVGLKDSAVPNVQHRLVYAASEQGKLLGLRQLLHPSAASEDIGTPLLPPFLVFTQTVERAIALHSELRFDIPAEAGGIGRIAVLHSDLSDTARDAVMTRFRKGEIWVLITTDLLSRGVDFRGVNGVVNYDIPTSSAAYVHRVGRTGRAGREGGVAVTLCSEEDIPYLKPIANLITAANKLKDHKPEAGTSPGVQSWLLDALPNLSKKGKQDLRKRGVVSRTSRGAEQDPRSARKSRISTKAGYLRREANNKRGAILGSRRRQEAADSGASDDSVSGNSD